MSADPSDPFAWLGELLDDLFGADDPHADYRADHAPIKVCGGCPADCCGLDHAHDNTDAR